MHLKRVIAGVCVVYALEAVVIMVLSCSHFLPPHNRGHTVCVFLKATYPFLAFLVVLLAPLVVGELLYDVVRLTTSREPP